MGWWACGGRVEGPLRAAGGALNGTGGRMARLKKSACFVMEFDVMRACVEVGKGAMMISQPSATHRAVLRRSVCARVFFV